MTEGRGIYELMLIA